MSSVALSKRAKWQDRANQGGAAHEKSVEEVFNGYFATEGMSDYEFVSKPSLLNQLFYEVDYEKNPEKYEKPEIPVEGDVYFDDEKQRFMKMGAKKATEARLGMIPDGMIRNKITGKAHLLEEKHQNNAGNAHERGYRYDTEKIRTAIQQRLGTDAQPVSWIFAGTMTEDTKYILEIQAHLPENHYVLIKSNDNAEEVLIDWFEEVIRPLLE
jgi:hypothetical protein